MSPVVAVTLIVPASVVVRLPAAVWVTPPAPVSVILPAFVALIACEMVKRPDVVEIVEVPPFAVKPVTGVPGP